MIKNILFSTILNYQGISDRENISINPKPGLQNVCNTFQRIPILNLLELIYQILTRLKSSNISTFACELFSQAFIPVSTPKYQ